MEGGDGTNETRLNKSKLTKENYSRRLVLKTLACGGTATTLSRYSGTVRAIDNTRNTISIKDDFNPQWYSVAEDHFKDRIGRSAYPAAVTIRRTLYFNDIYEGEKENILEFGLFSFGLGAYKDEAGGNAPPDPQYNANDHTKQIALMDVFGNSHTIRIESSGENGVNAGRIGTTYPLIGSQSRSNSDKILKELPDSKNDWTTGKSDLENAEIDPVSESDLPQVLGGAGLAFGIAAAPVSGGASLLLTGTATVLSAGSLVASLAESGDKRKQTEDVWEYGLENTCIGGGSVGRSAFVQNLLFRVPVKHRETAKVKVKTDIDNNGCSAGPPFGEPTTWVGENGSAEWTILIPYQEPFDKVGSPGYESAPVFTSPHPPEPYNQ